MAVPFTIDERPDTVHDMYRAEMRVISFLNNFSSYRRQRVTETCILLSLVNELHIITIIIDDNVYVPDRLYFSFRGLRVVDCEFSSSFTLCSETNFITMPPKSYRKIL